MVFCQIYHSFALPTSSVVMYPHPPQIRHSTFSSPSEPATQAFSIATKDWLLKMETLLPEGNVEKIICKFGNHGESAIDSSEREDSHQNKEKKQCCDTLQLFEPQTKCNFDKPCIIAPLPVDGSGECSSKESLVLTGTACEGGTAPTVGAVDIGVSKSAYYFRIALPGVKKDPDQFSCEIKHNGQINIRGVTSTGGESVSRYSRIFTMKIQHQRPPGPFTVSFSLPGPVDPRFCTLNFRSDGIFEAVVGKFEE